MTETVQSKHDVIAIGAGPFNLGLAALASTVDDLDLVVLESRTEFRWHPGLMFDDAMLQVSFLADLVSLVAPTHPLSFLSYLHDTDRMYPFYIREQFHPTRREYEHYLRWAASKLPSVHWSHRVEAVRWDAKESLFTVHVVHADGHRSIMQAKDLVLGVGTEPNVPAALAELPGEKLLHTADYLHRTADIEAAGRVTVVGSGQSGAEVALDLMRRNASGGGAMSWLTRTVSFAPLDYTKLVLEMTTPAYIRYFHDLPQSKRDDLVAEQWRHYKGISSETLEAIHDVLYQRDLQPGLADVELRNGIAIEASTVDSSGRAVLTCRHRDTGKTFEHVTDLVVAATGYTQRKPGFLRPVEEQIRRDDKGRYQIALDHSIELDPAITGRVYVSNADLHSHGVAAPDLGIGAFRNATILNSVSGRELYRLPKNTAYTSFAIPGGSA